MSRMKRGVAARKRKNRILKAAKGYYGTRHRLLKVAREAAPAGREVYLPLTVTAVGMTRRQVAMGRASSPMDRTARPGRRRSTILRAVSTLEVRLSGTATSTRVADTATTPIPTRASPAIVTTISRTMRAGASVSSPAVMSGATRRVSGKTARCIRSSRAPAARRARWIARVKATRSPAKAASS